MRLIECSTLKFFEFIGAQIPPYAILSHTWEEEEVSFRDFCSLEDVSQKKGWQKILQTCRLATKDGYDWVWIDTCCIDKSSSAELTEAINSMFKWYENAGRCYVYLSDFQSQGSPSSPDFGDCRWFTRGWTLQELIAPPDIHFYDKNWTYFGSKSEMSVILARITRISGRVLQGELPIYCYSIATRMSWAARRETTREEDVAYCLLGIFETNIPLVYGEGARAFTRLQEEIIKETNDLTLFAWRAEETPTGEHLKARGILARSPREFIDSRGIECSSYHQSRPEFTMTNKGLRIHTSLYSNDQMGLTWVMSLGCFRQGAPERLFGICLISLGGNVHMREAPHMLADPGTGLRSKEWTIYIMKDKEPVSLAVYSF